MPILIILKNKQYTKICEDPKTLLTIAKKKKVDLFTNVGRSYETQNMHKSHLRRVLFGTFTLAKVGDGAGNYSLFRKLCGCILDTLLGYKRQMTRGGEVVVLRQGHFIHCTPSLLVIKRPLF